MKWTSILFVLASPILFGMFLALPLAHYLGDNLGFAAWVVYALAWFVVWGDHYDEGRRL